MCVILVCAGLSCQDCSDPWKSTAHKGLYGLPSEAKKGVSEDGCLQVTDGVRVVVCECVMAESSPLTALCWEIAGHDPACQH